MIDFHTHIFPDKISEKTVDALKSAAHIKAYTKGTEASLIQSMDKSGIDVCVNLPVVTNPEKTRSINDRAISNLEKRIVFFGGIHPLYEDYREEIKRLKASGIKGIKIHPVYQGVDIDDIRFLRILDCIGENDMICVTHAGYDIGFPGAENASVCKIKNAVKQVGKLKLVLAHMGGWGQWKEAEELLFDTGVYLDTSFSLEKFKSYPENYYSPEEEMMLDGKSFVSTVRLFGADKILFGSDSPWSDQKESVDIIVNSSLTPDEKTKILEENAKRLLDF